MLLITDIDFLGLDPEIRKTLYKLKTQCQLHGVDLVVTSPDEINRFSLEAHRLKQGGASKCYSRQA